MRKFAANAGFTLIELMVTLIVVAIVVAIAAPGFGQMIRENRAATQANNVLASLQLARSEAVKRGVRVVMLSESGIDNIWEQGWIVFTDWNANSKFDGERDEKDCSIEKGSTPIFRTLQRSLIMGKRSVYVEEKKVQY